MNRGKQHIDEELLIRYLVGEVNEEESLKIQEWIALSDENREQFESLKKLWVATENPAKNQPAQS